MKTRVFASALLTTAVLAGCGTTGGDTAIGGGIGAAIGAGLGAIIGDNSRGTAIGAGIGAVTGAIIGYNWDRIIGKVDNAGGKKLGVSTTKMPDGTLKVNIPEGATFASNSYELHSTIFPVLNALSSEMVEHKELYVKVVGHTDSSGNIGINQPLSNNRASAVANYLASQGVTQDHIMTEGRADRDPIADNSTPEGRAQNRRVELFLYASKS